MDTGMFNVTIFDEKDRVLFYYNQTVGPIVSMEGLMKPGSVEFKRTSATNGQLSNYTWKIQPSNYL